MGLASLWGMERGIACDDQSPLVAGTEAAGVLASWDVRTDGMSREADISVMMLRIVGMDSEEEGGELAFLFVCLTGLLDGS